MPDRGAPDGPNGFVEGHGLPVLMAGYPTHSAPPVAHADAPNTLSVPWVIAAALLIAIGVFAVVYFLISFQLEFLGGIALVLGGTLMLLDPRAGSDHA